MFFGKKSDYIKFSEVISILEDEQAKYHHGSRASLDSRQAIVDTIKALKLHHIKKHPKRYMEYKKVMNNEAYILLKEDELKTERNLKAVIVQMEGGAE